MLLHLGTPKTGSSSIQASLFAASGANELRGVSYVPQNAHGKEHPTGCVALLYRQFENLPRVFLSRYRDQPEALAQDSSNYRSLVKATISAGDRLILSSEYLSSFQPQEITTMLRDLERMGVDTVKAVLYVRDPVKMYFSVIQQRLRASHRFPNPHEFHYQFRRAIEHWSDAIPNGVVVRPFAPEGLLEGCVVKDFLSLASVFMGEDFSHVAVKRRNDSVSAEAALIMQRYRRQIHPNHEDVFMEGSDILLNCLSSVMSRFPKEPVRLLPSVANCISERHSKDLEWLAETFDITFQSDQVEGEAPHVEMYGENLEDVLEPVSHREYERVLYELLGEIISRTLYYRKKLKSEALLTSGPPSSGTRRSSGKMKSQGWGSKWKRKLKSLCEMSDKGQI